MHPLSLCTRKFLEKNIRFRLFARLVFCRIVARGFNKFAKERTSAVRAAFELRVKLHADHPRVIGCFAYFNQIAFGVYACDYQSRFCQFVAVGVIEFVAVAVALPNRFGAVRFFCERTLLYFALVFSEPQRPPEYFSVLVGH